MSQSIRQNNLFAAEDWKKIYRAFLNVNFTSYDFDTIRQSLVEYIRINYPEDFNDFIDSSEFIAIIDLLAWLGQSLAFRVDLNVRENFIDTAERRESIIRLANLLSYKPRRNKAAQGFLKVVGIKTNADVIDSNGSNLNGTRINWNDPNNPDWNEQFVIILNSSLNVNNQFGQPIQKGLDSSGNNVQIYELNSAPISNPNTYGFTANIDGSSLNFENINVSFSDIGGFSERDPSPYSKWHMIYKNDGQGNQSKNTGFFTYFKQGTLQYQDFRIDIPTENRIIDINTNNINEDDVWVQTVLSDGGIETVWKKVPSANGNVSYNNLSRSERNIFSVETRQDDQVSIRFSDGRFGNVPFGNTRVYYRTSFGARTTIRPNNIQNIALTIPYITSNNLKKNITFYLSLQETITNGAARETNSEIKTNAAQVYYTQNRMVSGEDYNVFPLSDASILKCKAINRTYSGHNRYIDINDPTGKYQNTNVIGQDGIIYREYDNNRIEVNNTSGLSSELVISSILINLLTKTEFKNFILDTIKNEAIYPDESSDYKKIFTIPTTPYSGYMWDKITGSNYSCTGRIVDSSVSTIGGISPFEAALYVGISYPSFNSLDIIKAGSLIKFRDAGWVSVDSVIDFGSGIGNGYTNGEGNIRLLGNVEDGDIIEYIIPPIRYSLSSEELETIRLKIESNSTFGIFYNLITQKWQTIEPPEEGFNKNTFNFNSDSTKWMILFENNPSLNSAWAITARGLRFIFESEEDVRFFFVNKYKVISKETGLSETDHIRIYKTNTVPELNSSNILPFLVDKEYRINDLIKYNNSLYKVITTFNTVNETSTSSAFTNNLNYLELINQSLGEDIILKLIDNFTYEDGYIEPRKVQVTFTDRDEDGVVDDPTIFDKLIFGNSPITGMNRKYIFWQQYTSYDGYQYYKPIKNIKYFIRPTIEEAIIDMNNNFKNPSTKVNWRDGTIAFCAGIENNTQRFYSFDIDNLYNIGDFIPLGFNIGDVKQPSDQTLEPTSKYISAIGRNNLEFLWKHFAPVDHRIDPAKSNIVDIYVLTLEYDYLLRQYLKSKDIDAIEPQAPSHTQLALDYKNLDNLKMISDQLIWHPTSYKLLFGAKAKEELRARFKAIKLPTSSLSDGEIKSEIIRLIDEYFSIENWDFGDTFYFSELSAYIHRGLALQLASIVLVPVNEESGFGSLYEVKAEPDEIFISAATVNDIDIIQVNTKTALRINR